MTLSESLTQLSFYENKKLSVWQKGRVIPQYDHAVWRHDDFGSVIKYSDYGDRNSQYGWEFDHYPTPAALGGSDDVSNLRPLHYSSNASLGGILGGLINRAR